MAPTLWNLFGVFYKIGMFTIGGGYAMIPLIQREITKRDWLSEEELPDIIALSQSAPGILSVNVAIFAGYKMRGIKGAIVTCIGTVLPSFFIMLLIAAVFSNYKENSTIVSIFKGIRPVVVALIAVPTVNMARKGNKTFLAWLLTVSAIVAVAFLRISPVYVLFSVIIGAVVISLFKERRGKQ